MPQEPAASWRLKQVPKCSKESKFICRGALFALQTFVGWIQNNSINLPNEQAGLGSIVLQRVVCVSPASGIWASHNVGCGQNSNGAISLKGSGREIVGKRTLLIPFQWLCSAAVQQLDSFWKWLYSDKCGQEATCLRWPEGPSSARWKIPSPTRPPEMPIHSVFNVCHITISIKAKMLRLAWDTRI